MERIEIFIEVLQEIITAIESNNDSNMNMFETGIGEIEIKGCVYQLQMSLAKKENWINKEKVSRLHVVRNNSYIN